MPEQPNTPATEEQVEYEYVEVPEGQTEEYEYVEAPAAEAPAGEAVEYEYVEAPAAEAPAGEAVEYEYVEAPAAEAPAGEAVEYEYVEAPAAEAPAGEAIEYEYVEAPAAEAPAGEAVEYEYVEAPAAEEAAPAPEAPAGEAAVEYEYVEAPAAEKAAHAPEAPAPEAAVEYEYVEAPAAEEAASAPEAPAGEAAVEYEYVEAPAAEEAAPAAEAPAGEAVEYEYVEAPAAEEAAPAAEAPAGEAAVEYEYVEAPAAEEVASAPEAPSPEAAVEYEYVEAPAAEEAAHAPEAPAPGTVTEENPVTDATELETPETVDAIPTDQTYEPVADTSLAEQLEAVEQPVEEKEAVETAAETVSAVAAAVTGTAAIDALAEKAAEEANKPENNAQIVAEETQEEADPDEASDMLPATGAFSFDGTQTTSFTGSNVMDSVVLTNVSHAFDRLSEWNLLISEFSVTPLEGQNGAEVPLSEDVFCQGAFLNADGSQQPFENQTLLTVPADQTNLVLCGMKIMPLAGQENATIQLSDSSGMLIGPNGVQLMFSHVNKITVPKAVTQTESTPRSGSIIYDSAQTSEKVVNVFTFSAESDSAETDSENILVKTGYSLYGWNVVFANDQTMSLADVRTYQTKHGSLPDVAGTISYGEKRLTFKNAKKISVYEKPSYCGYGQKPAE